MTTKLDAIATIRFAIFDALITQMPVEAHPYLEQAAKVATEALQQPAYSWVFEAMVE